MCIDFDGTAVSNVNKIALPVNDDGITHGNEWVTVLDFAQVDSTIAIPATSKSGQAVNFLKMLINQQIKVSGRQLMIGAKWPKESRILWKCAICLRENKLLMVPNTTLALEAITSLRESLVYPFVKAGAAERNVETYFISNV